MRNGEKRGLVWSGQENMIYRHQCSKSIYIGINAQRSTKEGNVKIEQESVGFAFEKRSLSITEFCIREANAVAASSHQGPILFKG